jgi:hypothetical protein
MNGFFDRIVYQFKNRPFPIFDPIFQYSNIPASFFQAINRLGNENLFGSVLSGLDSNSSYLSVTPYSSPIVFFDTILTICL